jgi:hypothetical protein
LSLFKELRLERALPVTRHLDVYMPLLSFERFLTLPIARIPGGVALASMFGVAQVAVQFRFQAAFDYLLWLLRISVCKNGMWKVS